MVSSRGWVVLLGLALTAAVPSPRAKAAFERGEKALSEGQLDAAAQAYQEALEATPDYAEALNGLGSALFRQGRKEEALARFKAAVAADPNFKLGYFNLGYAARKTGDFASAAAAYRKYTSMDPLDPDGYFGLGESERQLGHAAAAIAGYQKYISLEQRPNEQKWVQKARGYVAQLQAQDQAPPSPSGSDLPAASPAAPADGAASRIADADRLMKQKRLADAIIAYEDALRAEPKNLEAQFKLGTALARSGNYRAAIEHWSVVQNESTDPAVQRAAQDNIRRAQRKLGETSTVSAVDTAPSAPASTPVPLSPARRAYEQGVKQILARDYISALESLTQAITAEPTLAVAYVARGSAQVGLRRFPQAIDDYQKALALDPSRASPLYGLAEAYRALGQKDQARASYEQYAQSHASDAQPQLQATARRKAAGLK